MNQSSLWKESEPSLARFIGALVVKVMSISRVTGIEKAPGGEWDLQVLVYAHVSLPKQLDQHPENGIKNKVELCLRIKLI